MTCGEKQNQFAHVNIAEFVVGKAEDLSAFPDGSIDAVVCTLVLCSVDNVDLCLREIRRVLRPVSRPICASNQFAAGGSLGI